MFEYGEITNPEEFQKLSGILAQCFIASPAEGSTYAKKTGMECFRVLKIHGEVAGGLVLLDFGQWWGGECVPMTGIAAVGIAPEYRGSGAALAMMQNAIGEIHKNGVSISVLYPAVQRLYRQVGYELAGSATDWEVATDTIRVREQSLPLKRVTADSQILRELYQKQARLNNGNLERNNFIWSEITQPSSHKQEFYAYLIGATDNPEGYIIYNQNRTDYRDYLNIRDWAILTPAAAKSFWSFLANHRSQIDTIKWKSFPLDYLKLLLPEATAKLKSTKNWMLRIVDVSNALSQRGYLHRIEAELHLEITDNLIAANNGKFILSVANGRGEVTKGGTGELKLDINSLAILYSNLYSPQHLHLMGELEGTQTAILTAARIFAGSQPWMADFF